MATFKNRFKLIENFSWLTFERVIRLAVGVLVGLMVARHLGVENFGLLSYALAWSGILGVISSFGMKDIVIRDLVRLPDHRYELIGAAFWLNASLVILCLTFFAIFLAVNHRSEQINSLVLIFCLCSMLFRPADVFIYDFEYRVQIRDIAICQIAALGICALFRLFLIWNDSGLVWFAFAVFLESALQATLITRVFARANVGYTLGCSVYWMRKIVRQSAPLALSAITIILYMRLDQIMLANFHSIESVGQYSAALRLSEAWYFIPMALVATLFPRLVELSAGSKEQADAGFLFMYSVLFWGSLAVALVVQIFGAHIIELLYGHQYSGAASILQLHIWSGVFVSWGVASSKWFILEELQAVLARKYIIGLLLNIGLNLSLIPIYGGVGAAIATLVSQAYVGFLSDFLEKEGRPVFLQKLRSVFHFRYAFREAL